MENQVKKLQEQVHFLVELLTEHQLEKFMLFCNNQDYVEDKENDPQILG
jgi:hypothetical protein